MLYNTVETQLEAAQTQLERCNSVSEARTRTRPTGAATPTASWGDRKPARGDSLQVELSLRPTPWRTRTGSAAPNRVRNNARARQTNAPGFAGSYRRQLTIL